MRCCYICRKESGTSLICEICRIQLSDYQKETLTKLWHDEVCNKAYDDMAERFKCFHCGLYFVREECCGDHWPDTKAAAPDLRWDVSAGVCSCGPCNSGGNGKRTAVKKNLCKKCRIRLPVTNGLCIVCR